MVKKVCFFNVLIDFIIFYYGMIWVEYFYCNYIKDYLDEEVDEQDFCYFGFKFVIKEEIIFMLVDSIEVVCKSLKNLIEEVLLELIDKIIVGKMVMG